VTAKLKTHNNKTKKLIFVSLITLQMQNLSEYQAMNKIQKLAAYVQLPTQCKRQWKHTKLKKQIIRRAKIIRQPLRNLIKSKY